MIAKIEQKSYGHSQITEEEIQPIASSIRNRPCCLHAWGLGR